MMSATSRRAVRERGFVLISSILLLIVMSILAVSMFRNFGIEERIAGNLREKQRALHSAESAQQYAEWWLMAGTNVNLVINCAAVVNANLNQGQVCSNSLPSSLPVGTDVTQVPWIVGGNLVGVDYTPPTMVTTQPTGFGTYTAPPRFYISVLGPSATGQGTVYQIDAVGYGGTLSAASVVESTYLVDPGGHSGGGL
jgi:type IV pilus assembly protein PilX